MTALIACGGAACAADGGAIAVVGGISLVGIVGFWLFGKFTVWRSSRRMGALAARSEQT